MHEQIQRAWVVTQLGLWIVILLILIAMTPVHVTGTWPMLQSVEATWGRDVKPYERDLFISINAAGDIFIGPRKMYVPRLANALGIAALPREQPPYWRQVFVRVDRRAPFGGAQGGDRRTNGGNAVPDVPRHARYIGPGFTQRRSHSSTSR